MVDVIHGWSIFLKRKKVCLRDIYPISRVILENCFSLQFKINKANNVLYQMNPKGDNRWH